MRRSAAAPTRASPPAGAAALPEDLRSALETLEARFADLEPQLLAFVPEPGRWERVWRDARALLRRFPDASRRPPLFGVPIGVKDIFHCRGLPTRAGSRLPVEALIPESGRGATRPARGARLHGGATTASRDAAVVAALRRAGALIVGKTRTTEFAYFAPAATRNPAAPGHTPGGSSSGSAAAVAGGLCALALGTQTIGSIGRPAAYCGVVGCKPTYGRISRAGVVPLAPSLDHVGWFTADVPVSRRVAAVLLSGWRPRRSSARRRPVLAVPDGPYLEQASADGRAGFARACDRLADAGFAVRRVAALADIAGVAQRHRLILAAEAARVHTHWWRAYRALYHAETAALIERGLAVGEGELRRARAGRAVLRRELETAMDREGIELWIAPGATGGAPFGLERTGDPAMSLPWTHAGMPAVTIPAGRSREGLPLGLQIAGRRGRDEELLAAAEELAAVVGVHG